MAKRDLREMDKLEAYLKEHGYKYTRRDQDRVCREDGFPIRLEQHQIVCLSDKGDRLWDAICHYGSYGCDAGLLEIMGTIVNKADGDGVVGWLTADDVIARLRGMSC